jgi:AAA+ ATPase superfamily predicted ATPase
MLNYTYRSLLLEAPMRANIVGRKDEQRTIGDCYDDDRPHFLVIYGRRRVGKTYLVREFFDDRFFFSYTGIANANKEKQLRGFNQALKRYANRPVEPATDWFEAFRKLFRLIEESPSEGKKVIFLDELPWMDNHKSGFLSAFEYFWNAWASARPDVLLIVCGSATSWITKNIFRNRGGLYNRVTRQIWLRPFTLRECEDYLIFRNVSMSRFQILESYMIFGGVPYYLSMFRGDKSLAQNVDDLCFGRNAALTGEYQALFSTLFNRPDGYIAVVEALAKKSRGLTRSEIAEALGRKSGGSLAKTLEELERCDFIRKYHSFGKKNRDALFQLSDPFVLFYHRYLQDNKNDDPHFWTHASSTGERNAWSGYAFEQTCLHHLRQIKHALGISGILTYTSSWRSTASEPNVQIDLVIERADGIVNLCEIKFSRSAYTVTREYDEKLRRRRWAFQDETHTTKALHTTLITTLGVTTHSYRGEFQSEVVMDDLFT